MSNPSETDKVHTRYFMVLCNVCLKVLMCVIPVMFCTIVRSLVYYTYSRTQLYLPLLLQGGYYNNDMFRSYM